MPSTPPSMPVLLPVDVPLEVEGWHGRLYLIERWPSGIRVVGITTSTPPLEGTAALFDIIGVEGGQGEVRVTHAAGDGLLLGAIKLEWMFKITDDDPATLTVTVNGKPVGGEQGRCRPPVHFGGRAVARLEGVAV